MEYYLHNYDESIMTKNIKRGYHYFKLFKGLKYKLIKVKCRTDLKIKLELKFLLNQDNNTIQDISKYSKIAKIITTKCGIPKLFVIRGRVIDTRIKFHYFKSNTSNHTTLINDHNDDDNKEDVDNVTATVTTTTNTVDNVVDDNHDDDNVDVDANDDDNDDMNVLKNQKFKLRFKPFTTFGGICTPAIGYNDPIQIPNMLSKQEQLCFIQAVQNDNNNNNNNNSNNNNNNVTYKLINNGYLVMDIDFNNFCDIYHLVFPFLNSKCPSTCKKDVHITVTLIDENEKELSSTEFEVVSCASPIRDARRYQQRQRIAELEYADKHLHKTPVTIDDLSEYDHHHHHHHHHHTVQPISQSSSKLSISDISPNSSGFGSFYSPLPSITSEEDHLNELQLYLSRSETSTPLHYRSLSVTTNSITNTITTTTTSNINSSFIDVDNKRCDILSPVALHSDLVDLSSWDRIKSMKRKHSNDSPCNDRHTRKLFRQSDEQMNVKMMDSKCPVKRPIKEINNGSCIGQEYVIKTKSRRIYRILSLLNRELSRHL
ncbi:hypothetical protein MN116_002502 [Schistosoma mekongi]|uniref:Uncharacterized protein n=1 Tax=Schistosoma mekongi TaxID=38744 RepID=A0AAE2D8S6_SCHME|nr:hypothetical protein MN116_002502 [Schistosoma mekongi]